MRHATAALAAAGAAAMLFLTGCSGGHGSQGTGSDQQAEDASSGESASGDQRCSDAAGGPKRIDDTVGDTIASPLPTTEGLSRLSDASDFDSAEWSENIYVVGWKNQNKRLEAEELRDAYIVVWSGNKGEDCEVVELNSGGKVDGGDPNWDLFTYQTAAAIPDGKYAALGFKNPADESDRDIVVDLWNIPESEGASPGVGVVDLLRAMDDELPGEAT